MNTYLYAILVVLVIHAIAIPIAFWIAARTPPKYRRYFSLVPRDMVTEAERPALDDDTQPEQ